MFVILHERRDEMDFVGLATDEKMCRKLIRQYRYKTMRDILMPGINESHPNTRNWASNVIDSLFNFRGYVDPVTIIEVTDDNINKLDIVRGVYAR